MQLLEIFLVKKSVVPSGLPVLSLLSLLAFAGCTDSGPFVIEGERELAAEEQQLRLVASDAERFRSQPQTPASGAGASASGISFDYELPEGWTEAPARAMRELNFTFGENGEGECYLTLLPGAGGGLEANINRWRGQMGLEPASPEEIAALPKKNLFGREAVFVSLDGNFKGFGAEDAKEDYRMLGLILWNEQVGSIFAKMTGPRELVEAEAENFDLFCSTIQPAQR